jgi:hypothetical protein
LVNTFPGFARNSFGKQQAATCPFSTEFRANHPGNVSTNRNAGFKFKRLWHIQRLLELRENQHHNNERVSDYLLTKVSPTKDF